MSKAERKQLVKEASEKLHNTEATDSGTSDLDNKNISMVDEISPPSAAPHLGTATNSGCSDGKPLQRKQSSDGKPLQLKQSSTQDGVRKTGGAIINGSLDISPILLRVCAAFNSGSDREAIVD